MSWGGGVENSSSSSGISTKSGKCLKWSLHLARNASCSSGSSNLIMMMDLMGWMEMGMDGDEW